MLLHFPDKIKIVNEHLDDCMRLYRDLTDFLIEDQNVKQINKKTALQSMLMRGLLSTQHYLFKNNKVFCCSNLKSTLLSPFTNLHEMIHHLIFILMITKFERLRWLSTNVSFLLMYCPMSPWSPYLSWTSFATWKIRPWAKRSWWAYNWQVASEMSCWNWF